MKKFQNLIGYPVRLYDATLDIINRGLRVLGVPLQFTIGGIAVGSIVTAATLTNACNQAIRPYYTVADMTIWLSPTGNDTTGNGSQTAPYATFTRALADVPFVLRHTVRIKPLAGNYTGFPVYNNYRLEGGRLLIDASFNAPNVYSGFSNQLIDDNSSGVPAGPSSLTRLMNRITVLGAPYTANSLAGQWILFKTGLCAGKMIPIWKNTTNELWFGPVSPEFIPGDLFDIVNPAVLIAVPKTEIKFDFATVPDRAAGSEAGFGLAGLGFYWLSDLYTPDNGKLISISNTTMAASFVNVWHPDTELFTVPLTLLNVDLNFSPILNLFENVNLNDFTSNWLNICNGGNGQPANDNALILTENSNVRSVLARCTFFICGSTSNYYIACVCWGWTNRNAANLKLHCCSIDDELTTNACLDFKASNIHVMELYIRNAQEAWNVKDFCSVQIDFMIMRPAALRGLYGIKAYNGVAMRISQNNYTITGTDLNGMVKFLQGDATSYAALAAPGAWLTDTEDCNIFSNP
jgi:hypothetical protein